jgi:hypothetical protein
MERVLVCVLAQTRAHQLTWVNFKRNLLEELDADLALCIGVTEDYDYSNPFWQHAKYRWATPEYDDFGGGFDRAQRWFMPDPPLDIPDWRSLLDVKGHWLGGIKGEGAQPGAAGILIFYRWLLLQNIMKQKLLEEYDRFIITRSDFYWLCPHPPLSVLKPDYIWFPDGEFYGGLSDRHLIVSSRDLYNSLNLIEKIVLRPAELTKDMIHHSNWNIEKFIFFCLNRNRLLSRVALFPYIMFAVRGTEDPTSWASGRFAEQVGMMVKYTTELTLAKRYEGRIKIRRDWEELARVRPDLFVPVWPDSSNHQSVTRLGTELRQVLTHHETVLYVDDKDNTLKHGALASSPRNVFLIVNGHFANLLHIDANGNAGVLTVPPTEEQVPPPLEITVHEYPEYRGNSPAERPDGGLPLFSLSRDGVFLCAEPSGRVVLDRQVRNIWECFRVFENSG